MKSYQLSYQVEQGPHYPDGRHRQMGHAIRLYGVLCGATQDNQHPYKHNPLKTSAQ